ncbi:hypothetical protein [Izhakiella capsodis]|nr:hypothetical protein [Izhakiella capsodis]
MKGIPMPSAVYSAAMMLTGDNLDGVSGNMIMALKRASFQVRPIESRQYF